eukprot:m.16010 g.16010  ORF g.16010 m.16010 type:complete len:95 (-) comp10527_c0_seq1:206-490(-)
MDLNRASEEDKLKVCRYYFYGGFLFLPWLWIVNAVWFFNESRTNSKIRSMVIVSALGAVVWMAALIAWAIIYQNNRADWENGDKLAVVIPRGYE